MSTKNEPPALLEFDPRKHTERCPNPWSSGIPSTPGVTVSSREALKDVLRQDFATVPNSVQEIRAVWDNLSALTQLGHVQPPGG